MSHSDRSSVDITHAFSITQDGITELSRMDEVTFHMSGTEAVMQAVRVARYQTRRNKIVRFTSAYHGWWRMTSNLVPATQCHHLLTRSPCVICMKNTLRVMRRRRDIACVLINPIQAMHPNRAATDRLNVD